MIRIYYDKITSYYDKGAFDEAYSRVDSRRKQKIDDLKNSQAKARSLAAGILLIKGAEDMGISHLLDGIEINEHGKPDFARGQGWHYNLSHSGEYVMLGIADNPIGVDIQEIKELKAKLADRFFHADEKAYLEEILHGCGDYNKDIYKQAFFRIWSLKESYVKYTGQGLGQGLDTFSVLDRLENSKIINDGQYVSAFWVL